MIDLRLVEFLIIVVILIFTILTAHHVGAL